MHSSIALMTNFLFRLGYTATTSCVLSKMASSLLEQTRATLRRVLGADEHPTVLSADMHVAALMRARGEVVAARDSLARGEIGGPLRAGCLLLGASVDSPRRA